MKKILLSLTWVLALAVGGTATAQNAHESSVKFNKTNENAVVADYEKPAEIVEAALKKQLESEGLAKGKNSKGYLTFSGVKWSKVSNEKVDVYFKVEGKKEKSTVTVFISKGYDNFISSGSDSRSIDNVKGFLNGLVHHANAHHHSLNIAAQEEAIKKAEKAYNSSSQNGKELMAQKEKLEKRIAENSNEATQKQKSLEEEKQKLETLKTQVN